VEFNRTHTDDAENRCAHGEEGEEKTVHLAKSPQVPRSMTNIAKRRALAACVILAAALLLRVINLDADPSALISRDFITDEGWWAHNARNAFFYGQWRIDEYNQGLYSAYLYTLLLYFTFKLFGITLTTVRILSAFGGWLTVVVLFLLIRREISERASLFASVLLGFSNLHIIYSRVGFVESTMVFFMACAFWLWSMRAKHYLFASLSGVAFTLTILTKITALYFLPGLALVTLALSIRGAVRPRQAVLFLGGGGLVAAAYAIFLVVPNFDDWLQLNLALGKGAEWPTGFSGRIQSILKLLGATFYGQAPLMTALSLVSLCLLVVNAARDGAIKAIRSAGELEITSAMLLIGYLVSISLTAYQPERRFLPVLFLMAILAATVLEKGWVLFEELADPHYQMSAVGWFAVLFLLPAIGILELRWRALGPDLSLRVWLPKLVLIGALIATAIVYSRRLERKRFRRGMLAASGLIFVLLFSALSLGLVYKTLSLWGLNIDLWKHGAPGDHKLLLMCSTAVVMFVVVVISAAVRARRISVPLLLGTFLFIEGMQVSTWLFQPTYTLKEANISLANTLTRNDTVVTYYETPLLSSAAKVICRSVRRGFNVNIFEQSDPDYILILRRDNWRDYALEDMPREEWPPPPRFMPAKIASFDLCPSRLRGPRFIVELYRLSPR
jgi:4-amino-4-deoxy-L-arabinose transferase-like glycosyltransferase